MEREPDIDVAAEGIEPAVSAGAGELAAVFAGGALGALARAGLAQALPPAAGAWPWPTFAVNVVASALLGYVVSTHRGVPTTLRARAFLATGVCGALSTFSTVMLELVRLTETSGAALAAAYGAASIAAGLAAVSLGSRIAHRSGR